MKQMLRHYIPNRLEQKAANYLKSLKILEPTQMNIENLCMLENLDYKKGNTSSYIVVNNYRLVTINKFKDVKQQQFEFLHELSHNHFEHNLMDPKQLDVESQADLFAQYLAIPSHMFTYIDFNSSNLIKEISELFIIPEDIVFKRLQGISNNYICYDIFFTHK